MTQKILLLACGAITGFIVSVPVIGDAQVGLGYWFSGAKLMQTDSTGVTKDIRSGYAAGVRDTLSAVLEIAMDAKPNGIILNLDKARDAILRGVSCLGSRSEGSFGQFAEFVESIWRGRDSNAASLLIEHACQ
jgi:hypothetical protein